MKILALSGSLREKSRNTGMLRYLQSIAPTGIEFTIADLHELPFYSEDIEKTPAAKTLIEQAKSADAFYIACPEYNYSIAPVLKNALDWISREPNNIAFAGKAITFAGAGGGMGTSRSQLHLRQVCVCLQLQALTYPEVFANAFTSTFDDKGDVVEEKLKNSLKASLDALIAYTK